MVSPDFAEQSPGSGTVHAVTGSCDKTKSFTVIKPSSISYSKDFDDPTWTSWTSGDKYLAARTWFIGTVSPTSVSFYHAYIYEDLDGETDTWPDGTTWYAPTGTAGPADINYSNEFPDEVASLKKNSNMLYNGSSWEDFNPTFSVPWVYQNQSSSLIPFYTATAGRNYYQSNRKTSVMTGGQTGGSQGPWQQ
jgi:hypothetical protein